MLLSLNCVFVHSVFNFILKLGKLRLCKLHNHLDILKRILNIIIIKLLLTEDQERSECNRKPDFYTCSRLNSFRNICKIVELQFIEAISYLI